MEEIERRRLERNAKKAKKLYQSHEKNKSTQRRMCLNASEDIRQMRKTYSMNEKKAEKIPLVLKSPKSYNLPNLTQYNSFVHSDQRTKHENKIYSPENKSSRFKYIKN